MEPALRRLCGNAQGLAAACSRSVSRSRRRSATNWMLTVLLTAAAKKHHTDTNQTEYSTTVTRNAASTSTPNRRMGACEDNSRLPAVAAR